MLVCRKCGSENVKAVDREVKNGRVPGTFRTVPSYFCENCKKYRTVRVIQEKEVEEYPLCKEVRNGKELAEHLGIKPEVYKEKIVKGWTIGEYPVRKFFSEDNKFLRDVSKDIARRENTFHNTGEVWVDTWYNYGYFILGSSILPQDKNKDIVFVYIIGSDSGNLGHIQKGLISSRIKTVSEEDSKKYNVFNFSGELSNSDVFIESDG